MESRRNVSSFSIDEHYARTHHWDLRLMRDGEVAVWAVTEPLPNPGDEAQTAIRIDDPLIATRVGHAARTDRTPWDYGRMTVRSWREGESSVVTLHGGYGGGLGGSRTMSLLHVGSEGNDMDHWTINALGPTSAGVNSSRP